MKEDHERDAAFHKAMHGKSAAQKSAFMAMINKDSKSQQAAADAYFKHWDNKDANIETEKDREVSDATRLSTHKSTSADMNPGS
jgi:sterol 24-C-methyltransferase